MSSSVYPCLLLLLVSLSSALRLDVNINTSTITDHVSPTMYGSGMETYNHGKRILKHNR